MGKTTPEVTPGILDQIAAIPDNLSSSTLRAVISQLSRRLRNKSESKASTNRSRSVLVTRKRRRSLRRYRVAFSDPSLTAAFQGPRLHKNASKPSSRLQRPIIVSFFNPLLSHIRRSSIEAYILPGELGHAIPVPQQVFNNHKFPSYRRRTMRAQIQFITVPTADTPGTALYLAFDQKRYLVGQISEGLQRACVQNGVGMKKIQDVLVTGNADLQSTGGLIGMILTLADANASSARAGEEAQKRKSGFSNRAVKQGGPDEGSFLSLYGPQHLARTLATARRFVFRKGMPIKVHEIKSDESKRDVGEPSWSDENVKVWAFAVAPSQGELEANQLPRNPLKRTFDEANGAKAQAADHSAEDQRQQKEDDQVTHGVVADMFGSKWRMDTLVERPLDEVKLPAKMWVRNSKTKSLDEYCGPLPGGTEPLPVPMPIVLTRNPWPGALVLNLPKTTPRKAAVSYIIVQHPRRGKFDVAAALKLPIEKSMYSQLSRGEEVVGSDGSTITPSMVLAPDEPGNGIAVIDLPSLEYVQELVDRAEWKSPEVTGRVGAIVWILGRGVAESPVLRDFMEARKHMEHIISSPDCCPNSLAMDSVSTSAIKLAAIDLTTFPVPHHDNKTLPQAQSGVPSASVQALPAFAHVAQRGQRIQLEPITKRLDDEIKSPLDTLGLIRESNSQEIMDLAQAARTGLQAPDKLIETEAWVSQVPMPDVEITTLGTGSALPSKYRNVSSTLVRVPGYGSYLFDAGENTLGQLRRVFKPADLELVLKDLRVIWISHLHADHHLGTVSVIKAWHQVMHGSVSPVAPMSSTTFHNLNAECENGANISGRYLTVISDHSMLKYLEEYDQIESFGYQHVLPLRMIPADPVSKIPSRLLSTYADVGGFDQKTLKAVLGLEDIQAVFVSHCHGAMAVSLTFPFDTADASSGGAKLPFKVSYSGDCRPSENFAKIGVDSTVLIHEATFEDDLQREAYVKRHSTVSEALGVGSLMRAKAVVLTHFSQRYAKIPVVDGFWDDQSNIEKAIIGSGEEQDRLQGIDDGEDEVQPADGPEEAVDEKQIWSKDEGLWNGSSRATLFDLPLGPLDDRKKNDMKVVIAFDYMKFKLRDMPRMEALRPALAKLFESNIGVETQAKVKDAKKAEKEKKWAETTKARKEAKKRELTADGGWKIKGRNNDLGEKAVAETTATEKGVPEKTVLKRDVPDTVPQKVTLEKAATEKAVLQFVPQQIVPQEADVMTKTIEKSLSETKDVDMTEAEMQKEWEELTASR